MNYLAIDSCSSVLSVALSRMDEIFYTENNDGARHSELVMDLIDSQMKEASLKPNDLNGVFCMGGPGSFTGLRIGFSIAKALALSLSIQFAAVPALDCVAFGQRGAREKILAVISAGKNSWFYAFFKDGIRLAPDADADISSITDVIKKIDEPLILTGPGSEHLQNSLPLDLSAKIIINNEKSINSSCSGGYARQILAIAKYTKILDNNNSVFLFSGPEYIRKVV